MSPRRASRREASATAGTRSGRRFSARRASAKRADGIRRLPLQCDRRFEDGALTLRGWGVDRMRLEIGLDGRERAFPIGLRGAVFEHRGAGPGQRRDAMRFRCKMMRGIMIAATPRLDMQSAQSEKPGFGSRHHLVESGLGGGAILRELRGLRAQQQRQRLFRQVAAGLVGRFAREPHVAGARRENAAGKRRIALVASARLARQRHQRGNAEDETQDRPQDRNRERAEENHAEPDKQRRLDPVALPGEDDVARTIGKPGKPKRDRREDGEENENADHDLSHSHDRGLARRAIASLARLCAALSAAMRASNARAQSCERALAGSGSFVQRSCARLRSPRSRAAWICEASAAGSLPCFFAGGADTHQI